jgi:hypothetical protein
VKLDPDTPSGLQEVHASRISPHSAHEGGKVVSLQHRPLLPSLPLKIFLVLISLRGWADPRAIVQPQGSSQWKIPATPSGIKPATFRAVSQCLNQLRHRVPNSISWHRLRNYGNASLGVHNKAKHNPKYGDELLEGDKTTHTLTPVILHKRGTTNQTILSSTLYFTSASTCKKWHHRNCFHWLFYFTIKCLIHLFA